MCKICDRFWDKLWERSDAWERKHSNVGNLWSGESDPNRDLINQACDLQEANPAGAFHLYVNAAKAGSVWAMERVGWHYHTGTGVAEDLDKAQDHYYRAACAGSWMATIYYARLLAEIGDHDRCDQVLKDGIAADFVPAYFWLAWLRYERAKSRNLCREVRPFLEYAASQGHPGAQITLARWMTVGKFGLGEIPRGLKAVARLALRSGFGGEEDVGVAPALT